MKALTAFGLILNTLSYTAAAACYYNLNVTRGENITLTGAGINTTWTAYHNSGNGGKHGWLPICTWGDGRYLCNGDSSTISNLTFVASRNSSDRNFKAESYTNNDDYEVVKSCYYNIKIIELPTTRAPTTVRTTRETTYPTTTASTTTETTQLDTTVHNSTVLVGYLLREESTTEQTEATSSAFSSTANLTSLAWTNETGLSLMHGQPYSGLDIQITFLVVCGIFILVVLLYFVCCKAREKSRRPIYRPVIGEPQPLQVDGGLRNLLFSFTVW